MRGSSNRNPDISYIFTDELARTTTLVGAATGDCTCALLRSSPETWASKLALHISNCLNCIHRGLRQLVNTEMPSERLTENIIVDELD